MSSAQASRERSTTGTWVAASSVIAVHETVATTRAASWSETSWTSSRPTETHAAGRRVMSRSETQRERIGSPSSYKLSVSRQLGVERGRPRGDLDPVEARDVLGGLGDDAEAQRRVRQHEGHLVGERARVARLDADADVVVPAQERSVAVQAHPLGLRLELLLVRARAGDEEAHVADALDHARQGVEGDLEALLVDQAPDQQHELLRRAGESGT